MSRPPDPRVQRTRPYASLGGSPLTRHPLGGTEATTRQAGRCAHGVRAPEHP